METTSKRTTIKDIADELGVSAATVNRALDDRGRISSEMKARVLEKADKMGYRPNSLARTLGKNKPVKIAALLPGGFEFWKQIRDGVYDSVAEWLDFNVDVLFCDDYYEDNITHQLGLLERQKQSSIDGVLVVPFSAHIFRKPIDMLVSSGVPVVTVNRDCPDSGRLCYVGENAYGMGYTVGTAYLRFLRDGDSVAVLSVDSREAQIMSRTKGFLDALTGHEGDIRIVEHIHSESGSSVYDVIAASFKEYPNIKAVFANTAQGAYWVADAKRDLSLSFLLSGIDVAEKCLSYIDQKLIDFTVSQNPYSQGYNAARVLCNYLIKGETPLEEHVFTNVEIIMDRNHYMMNWKKM